MKDFREVLDIKRKCMQNVCNTRENRLNPPFYKGFACCRVLQIWLAPEGKNLEEILSSFFILRKLYFCLFLDRKKIFCLRV